jgi:hypothetical protein
MKMVKSLLLGSAAGLVAVAGAQAADLPVKAKPVQYVKICSLYGAGFYYIPGTDTCLKLGGYVRAEMNFNANGSFNPFRNQDFDAIGKNEEVTRIRGGITVDVRSQTAYGTLRAYATMFATSTNGSAQGGSPYDPIFAPAYFIQFAGFTAGKTASFFDFDLNPYTNMTTWWGSNQGGNGIPVFAYTAQFGNGFSASISAEDTTTRRMSILDGSFTSAGSVLSPAAAPGATGYGGRRWPDVVANLRIDQAWGSAQVMGAIHDVYANLGGGVDDSEVGWALGAGLRVNLPMIGKGDYIMGQFTYTEGALNYVLSNSGTGGFGAFWLRDGAAVNGAYGPAFDAVQTAAGTGNLDLTKAWSVTAGFEHVWNPQWKTSLYGAYGSVSYSGAASTAIGAGGDADWSAWNLGTRTVWTPVANLDLSVDIVYNKINGAYSNAGTDDYDFVAGIFRVQRNFWP